MWNISGVWKSLKTISGQGKLDSQAVEDQTWVNDMNLFFKRYGQTPTPPPAQSSLLPSTSSISPAYCPILTYTSLSTALMSQTPSTAPPWHFWISTWHRSGRHHHLPPGQIAFHLERPGSTVKIMFFDFSSSFNTIHPALLEDKLELMGGTNTSHPGSLTTSPTGPSMWGLGTTCWTQQSAVQWPHRERSQPLSCSPCTPQTSTSNHLTGIYKRSFTTLLPSASSGMGTTEPTENLLRTWSGAGGTPDFFQLLCGGISHFLWSSQLEQQHLGEETGGDLINLSSRPAPSWDALLTQCRWWERAGWWTSCHCCWNPTPCRSLSQLWAATSATDWYTLKASTHRPNRWISEAFGETLTRLGTNMFGGQVHRKLSEPRGRCRIRLRMCA